MWIASSRGFHQVVDVLCSYGVNPDTLHPITQDSPLQLAILGKHENTIKTLRNYGATSLTINLDRLEKTLSQSSYSNSYY